MSVKILATDLDRTLLPNGNHKFDFQAYKELKKYILDNEIKVIYVSGRRLSQIKDAINNYEIPLPDFCISMVGTKIYFYNKGDFKEMNEWQDELEKQWSDVFPETISKLLSDIKEIYPQGKMTTNRFKQSFFADIKLEEEFIYNEINKRLSVKNIPYSFTYSVDVNRNIAQIDIMPPKANKLEALKYIIGIEGYNDKEVLVAGDSGNDISMLTSGMKGVLVKNAKKEVKDKLISYAEKYGIKDKIYIAKGNEFNGNYGAGILEGLIHFSE
ncbi:MAG: HAD-IIB family hydrolase [Nanobdellota archaeon]